MKKQNELEVGLELIKKNIPELKDGWHTKCHSFNAFNIVTFLFGKQAGSRYVREYGHGFKSATAELLSSAYFESERRKNQLVPDDRSAILDIIPIKQATTGLILRAKNDNPLLFKNYMDMKLGDGATVGLFLYGKYELKEESIGELYEEVKKYIANPEDHLGIPIDDKIRGCINDFNSIMEVTKAAPEFKSITKDMKIDDISDFIDFIAVILTFYIDNFFNYLTSIDQLEKRIEPNSENRNYYSSGISVIEVEDPLFKENFSEGYRLLTKYKELLTETPEIIDVLFEKIFVTVYQLYIVNFIYMLQVANDTNDDQFMNLEDMEFYSLCKHFRIQMGIQSIPKKALDYNLKFYEENNGISDDVNPNATRLTSDDYLKNDNFDKKLNKILKQVEQELGMKEDYYDDFDDEMPRYLN